MVKEAFRSIKDDFSRSLFYWLTFVLTSFFIFLYFHLSYSDIVGVTIINSQNTIATVLTVLVIAICMIVIFFANSFLTKKKSQDIAIRLVCGGTYFQIVQYLLIQTGILLIAAIPVGITFACLSIPLLNEFFMQYFHISNVFIIRWDAMISTSVILVFEVIWCTVLNLGYAYRHSIYDLLNHIKVQTKFQFPSFFEIPINIKKWGSLLLFVGPVILFYVYGSQPQNLLFLSLIGMIGLSLSIDHFLIPQMNQYMQTRWVHHRLKIVYCGILRSDVMLLKKNMILLIVSIVLILSMLIASIQRPTEVMLAMISFVAMNVLLSLAIMFCYSTEIVGRVKMFSVLERLGYMRDDQKKIVRYEVIGLYGLIMGISFIYVGNMLIVMYIHHYLAFDLIRGLFVAFVFPLSVCGFINYCHYIRVIDNRL